MARLNSGWHAPRPSPSYCVALRAALRCASSRAAPSEPTEADGVCVAIRGLRAGAPGKNRTYDLGFRKGERARGVVNPYDSRTFRFSSGSLLLRSVVAASRYHAITIDALDGAAQVVRVEVGIAAHDTRIDWASLLKCVPTWTATTLAATAATPDRV